MWTGPGRESVSPAWLIKTRAAYSRGIECWHMWPDRRRAKAVVRGRLVFQTVARRNLSDEERVSRISPGDFHGLRKIHYIHLIWESSSGWGNTLSYTPFFPTCARLGCAHIDGQSILCIILCCRYMYFVLYAVLLGEWRNKYFYSLFKYYYSKFEKLNLWIYKIFWIIYSIIF